MGNGLMTRPRATPLRPQVQFPLARSSLPTVSGGEQADIVTPAPSAFPDRNWDPDWKCWLAVADFGAVDWRARIKVDPPPGADATGHEIATLLRYARDERPNALDEIVAQHDNIAPYFDQFLLAGPDTHPATAQLVTIAVVLGQMVTTHFKAHYNRARPSQLCPALLPPMQVPGHPAYPSGHAMQSQLAARALALVRPEVEGPLLALAARIARNREVAGFHYPSDSAAGQQAAEGTFAILRELPSFTRVVDEAKREWPSPTQ